MVASSLFLLQHFIAYDRGWYCKFWQGCFSSPFTKTVLLCAT